MSSFPIQGSAVLGYHLSLIPERNLVLEVEPVCLISTVCSIKHFYSVQYIYICVFKYIYVYTYIYTRKETSTNKSLSPWEPRTRTKGKKGAHVLKSRKYGNNLPFSLGSQQQRERDGHCKLLKQRT